MVRVDTPGGVCRCIEWSVAHKRMGGGVRKYSHVAKRSALAACLWWLVSVEMREMQNLSWNSCDHLEEAHTLILTNPPEVSDLPGRQQVKLSILMPCANRGVIEAFLHIPWGSSIPDYLNWNHFMSSIKFNYNCTARSIHESIMIPFIIHTLSPVLEERTVPFKCQCVLWAEWRLVSAGYLHWSLWGPFCDWFTFKTKMCHRWAAT